MVIEKKSVVRYGILNGSLAQNSNSISRKSKFENQFVDAHLDR